MPRGFCWPTESRGGAAPRLLCAAAALVCACATSPSSTRAARAPSPQAAGGFQSARVFTDPATGDVRYLLYLPRASEDSPDRRPLILFLHGDGERGDDLELVKREGLPKILEHNRDFPFAVVSPQCPRRRHWSVEVLDRLLTDVSGRFRVDPDRIYATGLSSGAVASLELAALRSGRLAAVAAVAPYREPRDPCRAAAVPVWLFHNADDERVSAGLSRRLARRLRDCGGTARLTIFPRSGHDAWSEAYFRADLYDWFLRNRRPSGRPMMN